MELIEDVLYVQVKNKNIAILEHQVKEMNI